MAETIRLTNQAATDPAVASDVADILATATILAAYFSNQGRVYPTLAAGATIISAATDWGLGAIAQIIPAATVTSDYYLHSVNIETCDKNGIFELVLYQGAGDAEITRLRFAIAGGFFGNSFFTLNGPLVPANARIRAQLASSDGLANQATITISLCYHLA